ncbi:MAG: four helix bundle protein [Balneolaceae bacterium]|nr:four helix bundle protein [Balneolaceae bacterium]
MKSYRDLDIYNEAFLLAIKVHKMSLELPNYELYEQGSQIRRSSKSIKDNIIEGYGRKRYKQDFIRFLTYSQSSCDETIGHLQMISETHDLALPIEELVLQYELLGKKIFKFIQYVESNWNDPKPATRNL